MLDLNDSNSSLQTSMKLFVVHTFEDSSSIASHSTQSSLMTTFFFKRVSGVEAGSRVFIARVKYVPYAPKKRIQYSFLFHLLSFLFPDGHTADGDDDR